jgi:hypothetical protein
MERLYIAYALILLTIAGLVAGIAYARYNSRDRVYRRRRMRERAEREARRR